METIGDRIRTKRKELGLTQVELGEKLNVTDRAVSKWEQNDGNPDIAFLPKLAQIFNVSIDYLLTGTEPPKEIIIKSPKEMLFETDDVLYLDKISPNELNIIEIYNHKLVNTFEYLVDNSKIKSYLRLYDSRKIIYMLLISNRLDKITFLGFNDIGLADEKELTDEMIDEIVSGERVNDATRNYILSIHCRELKNARSGNVQKNTDTFHGYGNWQLIYPRLLDKFALAKKWDWVKKILDIAFAIDKPNAEIYEQAKKEPYSQYRRYLAFTPPNYKDTMFGVYSGLQVFAVPYSTLQTLLKEKQYELLNYANSINEMLDKEVIAQKIIDSALIDADNALSEEDKFLKHAVYNKIINSSLLESCNNLKLVRKILDDNYYHYYEMVCDLLTSNRTKELFEFFVDNGYDEIAQLLLYRDKKEILNRSFTELIVVPERTDRPEYKAHKSLLDNQHRISMGDIESYIKARMAEENVSKNRFLSGRSLIDEYVQLDNNWVVDYIKGLKEKIYQRIVDRQELEKQKKKEAAEREKLAKGLTKDYFANLLDSGKLESIKLFKLELCSLLDAIFLYDYHYAGEDFSERMNEHFKQIEKKLPQERYISDDWEGYSVPDTKYNNDVVKPAKEHAAHLRDIFYRLRVLRNNILHPEKISVQDLTEDEMKECLEYVFSINKKVEE